LAQSWAAKDLLLARALNPLGEPIARVEMVVAQASDGADISVCRAGQLRGEHCGARV
jgi:hypothetical protein